MFNNYLILADSPPPLLPSSRWNCIVEMVEQKKDHLDSILRLQNYLLECTEIKSQIQDKRKAIDATQYVGSDLGGVLALQRRLSTMEGALAVLEPKLVHLQVGRDPPAATGRTVRSKGLHSPRMLLESYLPVGVSSNHQVVMNLIQHINH